MCSIFFQQTLPSCQQKMFVYASNFKSVILCPETPVCHRPVPDNQLTRSIMLRFFLVILLWLGRAKFIYGRLLLPSLFLPPVCYSAYLRSSATSHMCSAPSPRLSLINFIFFGNSSFPIDQIFHVWTIAI